MTQLNMFGLSLAHTRDDSCSDLNYYACRSPCSFMSRLTLH